MFHTHTHPYTSILFCNSRILYILDLFVCVILFVFVLATLPWTQQLALNIMHDLQGGGGNYISTMSAVHSFTVIKRYILLYFHTKSVTLRHSNVGAASFQLSPPALHSAFSWLCVCLPLCNTFFSVAKCKPCHITK